MSHSNFRTLAVLLLSLFFCSTLPAQTNVQADTVEVLPNVSGGSIFWIDNYNNRIRFSNGSSPGEYPMVLTNVGDVGINTLSPGYTLDVNGSGHFSAVT